MLAAASQPACSYIIERDEAAFLAAYGNPTEAVDFTRLLDGRTFTDARYVYSPFVRSISGSPISYSISGGWSSTVSIGSTEPGCSCAWQAVRWTAPGTISGDFYGSLYLEVSRPMTILALNTGADFIGLIPESVNDSFYLLPSGLSLLRVGFSPITNDVPEPASGALVAVAMIASARAVTRRRPA